MDAGAAKFFQRGLSSVNETVQQLQGAVALYCEMNGLKGGWTLNEDGTKLVLPQEPKTVEMPDLKSAAGGANE